MVYYIRFLKTPKYCSTRIEGEVNVKAYITITTDLGDDFFPGQLTLTTSIYNGTLDAEISPVRVSDHRLFWSQGMRGFPVNIFLKTKELKHPLRLRMVCKASSVPETQVLVPTSIPDIVSIWSDSIEPAVQISVSTRVERRFSLGGGSRLSIWEEAGDSISRHLWFVHGFLDNVSYVSRDAGLGLVAYLQDNFEKSATTLYKILHKDSHPINVLELGSGCGIVGKALAQLVCGCTVTLTDLPEAMEILNYNISTACVAQGSELVKQPLDWNYELPCGMQSAVFDLILISDCTYNCDSLPALIRTLSALVSLSPAIHVILSLKFRHTSEAVFFDLMAEAGFKIIEHVSIAMPDDCRIKVGLKLEMIDIYIFNHQTVFHSPGDNFKGM